MLLIAMLALGCDEAEEVPAEQRVAGGDAVAGRQLVERYACGACHAIPGVRGARGHVGPPLHGFGLRAYVAGRLPNRPANLTLWLESPPAVDPETAMPDLGIEADEARHIAAFLYTLRQPL